MIKVKLFGIAKDIAGTGDLSISENLADVNELLLLLKEKYPAFNILSSLLVAVNEEYASNDTALVEDDEVAIIPPVSGG